MSRVRLRLVVVSGEIPSSQAASGFAPRLYHFLKAAHASMDVTLVLINLSQGKEVRRSPDLFPVDRACMIEPAPVAWREPELRGRLLRAVIQYPFDPLPYPCFPRRLPVLRQFLEEQRPDVVVLSLPYLSQLVDHCPADSGVIALLDEPWEWLVSASLGNSRKDRWLARREAKRFSRLYRRIGERVEAVVAISEIERTYFSQMITSEKIEVIPHGIDTQYFRPADVQEGDIDVLVVGKLLASHNLIGALRTWEASAAAEGSARWKWGFVGEIDSRVAMRLRAAGCVVTGGVPDVRPFYGRARCVLVPALTGRGVKTTSLQAWAMRRPLIASSVGAQGLPASPGDNILIGADPPAMVGHIKRVLDDSALAQDLAANGRDTVERLGDSTRLAEGFARLCVRAAARSSDSGKGSST